MNTKKGDLLISLWRDSEEEIFDHMKISRINSSRKVSFERRTYVPIDELVYCDKKDENWVIDGNVFTGKVYYEQIECSLEDHDDSSFIYILIDASEGVEIWQKLKYYLSSERYDSIDELIKSSIEGIFDEEHSSLML